MTIKKQIKDLKQGDVFYIADGHIKAVVTAIVPIRYRVELDLNGTPHEIFVEGDKTVETDEKD